MAAVPTPLVETDVPTTLVWTADPTIIVGKTVPTMIVVKKISFGSFSNNFFVIRTMCKFVSILVVSYIIYRYGGEWLFGDSSTNVLTELLVQHFSKVSYIQKFNFSKMSQS